MRLKDYASKDGKRVWLSESEIGLLLDHTDPNHVEMRIAFVLAARCGLDRDADEPLVQCDPSTIYDWVARARDRCRAATGDDGWKYVGPHDLRRSWGVRLLEAGVLPSVVMELGGWEDWQTFRDHYLAEFSPEALRRERAKVGWLAEGRADPDPPASQQGYSVLGSGSNYPK